MARPASSAAGPRSPPAMNDDRTATGDSLPLSQAERIDAICDRFETAARAGGVPRIEACLEGWDGGEPGRGVLFGVLLGVELELRRGRGERPTAGEYAARFPAQAAAIADAFSD